VRGLGYFKAFCLAQLCACTGLLNNPPDAFLDSFSIQVSSQDASQVDVSWQLGTFAHSSSQLTLYWSEADSNLQPCQGDSQRVEFKNPTARLSLKALARYKIALCTGDLEAPLISGFPAIQEIDTGQSAQCQTEHARYYNESGSGTRRDPYKICRAEQLAHLASTPSALAKSFLQTNDLDLGAYYLRGGSEFRIGCDSLTACSKAPFSGTYDGGGFEVKGFKFTLVDAYGAGFFGKLENARVENLNFIDPSLTSSNHGWMGVVSGMMSASTMTNVTIKGATLRGVSNVGTAVGIVGSMSVLSQVHAEGSLSPLGSILSTVGGIVGSGAFMGYELSFSGTINGGTGNTHGGVVGFLASGSWLTNCVSHGSINASGQSLGGIVGHTSNTRLSRVYSDMQITSLSGMVGGIVGNATSVELWNSFFIGSVSGTSATSNIGRIFGSNASPSGMSQVSTMTSVSCINGGVGGCNSIVTSTYPDISSFKDPSSNVFNVWGNANAQSHDQAWVLDASQLPRLTFESDFEPDTSAFSRGSGTLADPYLLESADQLLEIKTRAHYVHKNFLLNADLDLSVLGAFSEAAIGTWDGPFTGTLDGGFHTLFNYTQTAGSSLGFFGRMVGAEVSRLRLQNPSVSAGGLGGLLAGYLIASTVKQVQVDGGVLSVNNGGGISFGDQFSTIEDVSMNATIIGVNSLGGISGNSWRSNIRRVLTSGSITSTSTSVGGVLGISTQSELHDSVSTMAISGVSATSNYGPMIGQVSISHTIDNSSYLSGVCTLTGGGSCNTLGSANSATLSSFYSPSWPSYSSWNKSSVWTFTGSSLPQLNWNQ
jgi:hypothetical protein